jgi:GMP synthase-like glutamine amidotransferase
MRILSMVHGPSVRAEVFEDVILAEGHELEEWSVVGDPAPPRPIEEYDAVIVLGGHMNVDQEQRYPWLRDEDAVIRGLVEHKVPFLGICLGGQLLAKATDARVGRSPEPERGFTRVTLLDEAAGDPIFGALPHEFDVFNLHGYAFETPPNGVELARSRVCAQAFRVGDAAWGVQFHPEVRLEQVEQWFAEEETVPDGQRVLGELAGRIDEWQRFGEALCRSFLAAARHSAAVSTGSSARAAHSCHEPT